MVAVVPDSDAWPWTEFPLSRDHTHEYQGVMCPERQKDHTTNTNPLLCSVPPRHMGVVFYSGRVNLGGKVPGYAVPYAVVLIQEFLHTCTGESFEIRGHGQPVQSSVGSKQSPPRRDENARG